MKLNTSLRLTVVQTELYWENKLLNQKKFSQILAPLAGSTDLIVLPEMFTTGFSMNTARLAEPMDGQTVLWMRQQAQTLNAAITGSFIVQDDGHYFNRLLWMFPDGELLYYDKRHLFSMAGEHKHYSAGNRKLIVDLKGWKICPQICYDLRFPAWSRNLENFDLLLYVANWPSPRRHHWRSLLAARAIENQCYTVGVNRIGKDGNELHYSGDTTLIDYKGEELFHLAYSGAVFTTSLDLEKQKDYRQGFPFLNDKDIFEIK